VSARTRISLLVAVVAVAAAGVTVGATLLTRAGGGETAAGVRPRPGSPELDLDLGVRTDAEAVALRRASALYGRKRYRAALAIFRRYRTLEARVGAALSAWPDGFPALAQLAREHPRSGLVQLELGLAYYWQGKLPQAQAAWRRAARVQPDTSYAVRAADLLHPRYVPGLPPFVPSFSAPKALDRLSPPQQVAWLAARARRGGARDKLLYGVALQGLGRPVSAEREFAAAAALAPHDADAQVAAAVGLFDKARPAAAFSRLGPLTRTFPHAATVRFHLGLLLLWIDEIAKGKAELRRVIAEGTEPFAGYARSFLAKLAASAQPRR